jgi:hypothetical protein
MKRKKIDVAQYEKAISDKYGENSVANPRSTWDNEKEAEYLEQVKMVYLRDKTRKDKELKEEHEGFFVSSNLFISRQNRKCEACSCFSLDKRDTLYLNKYSCCQECYVRYVEDREERWLSGWRPNEVTKDVNT